MNPASRHLTEDELDEVLMGLASEEAGEHAVACVLCRERVALFQQQMQTFNQASIAWSQARSNTLNRDLAALREAAGRKPATLWSAAAAAAFAAIFCITALQNQPHPVSPHPAAEAVVHNPHPAGELASDNEMLSAIDSEFGTPQAARFGLYQLDANNPSTLARRAQAHQVKD